MATADQLFDGSDAHLLVPAVIDPQFRGMFCKDCKKPFWVWNTAFDKDEEELDAALKYAEQGHYTGNAEPAVAGDINQWCSCKGA